MVYELVSGHGEGCEVLYWAPSGRGRERDPEVEDAMDRLCVPGKTCIYITWAPVTHPDDKRMALDGHFRDAAEKDEKGAGDK